jgi:hypothetical protein
MYADMASVVTSRAEEQRLRKEALEVCMFVSVLVSPCVLYLSIYVYIIGCLTSVMVLLLSQVSQSSTSVPQYRILMGGAESSSGGTRSLAGAMKKHATRIPDTSGIVTADLSAVSSKDAAAQLPPPVKAIKSDVTGEDGIELSTVDIDVDSFILSASEQEKR